MEYRNSAKAPGFLLGAAILVALLAAGGCNWGVPDFTLDVILEEGVAGTPETGQYTYQEMSTVEFNYTGVNPLHTVEVFLNDRVRKAGTGTIVMFGDDYRLKASLVDIRGTWKITMTYSDASITAPDPFNITVTGADLLSGDFVDDRGYHGTWTAESNNLILAYWDWNFYLLSGSVFGLGTDKGIFSGEGLSGSWTAEKVE